LPAHGVQARALAKLVLEGSAAPRRVIESYGCGELATLHYRDAGMITTINDPHGKINSEPKQFCFVRGGIQLSRRTSETLDPANPDGCH
jgi:hypothetical protein